MVRILSDGIVFQGERQRGVQRYSYELFGRLGASEAIEMFFTARPRAEYPKGVVRVDVRCLFPRARWNVGGRAWRQVRKRWWRPGFAGHELFHSTYFTRSPERGIPEVVTVYDMIAERFGELCGAPLPWWCEQEAERKRGCILGAKRIIAISEATAGDVGRLYPGVASRVRVVHLGAEHLAGSGGMAGTGEVGEAGGRYALFVGERLGYKNFEVVLRAMRGAGWPGGMRLVVVGPEMEEWERAEWNKMGLGELGERVEVRGRVTDEELAGLYSGATCFIFPSLGEGFGFPVLEAQGRGTPVVCSDIGVFHEVAGEGAMFFAAEEAGPLAAAVGRCESREVREELIERGRRNVGRFSWDRCAAQTLAVYREAVAEAS